MTTDPFPPDLLVGLTGAAGAGKDSCAAILAEHGFRTIAFADALRAELADAFRIDMRLFADRDAKEQRVRELALGQCADTAFINAMALLGHDLTAPRSPRWIMQRWGTEYRRGQSLTWWTDLVAGIVHAWRAGGHTRICVTDVRFQNELDALQRLRGRIVQVVRPGAGGSLAADTAGHPSEPAQRLYGINRVVHNDGDIGHLRSELVRVLGVHERADPADGADAFMFATHDGRSIDARAPWPFASARKRTTE